MMVLSPLPSKTPTTPVIMIFLKELMSNEHSLREESSLKFCKQVAYVFAYAVHLHIFRCKHFFFKPRSTVGFGHENWACTDWLAPFAISLTRSKIKLLCYVWCYHVDQMVGFIRRLNGLSHLPLTNIPHPLQKSIKLFFFKIRTEINQWFRKTLFRRYFPLPLGGGIVQLQCPHLSHTIFKPLFHIRSQCGGHWLYLA